MTISSSTPCISCTIFRTRQADAHDSKSQFKRDYASWRGPLRIFFSRKIPRHANKHSRRGKNYQFGKQDKKNEIKSGSLTFVVIHRFGLHGKGSHYQTHVDFCLQTGCVGACEFVRACVRLNDSGLGRSASGVALCVAPNEVGPSAGRTCATSSYYHSSCCLHAHAHPLLLLLRGVCACVRVLDVSE